MLPTWYSTADKLHPPVDKDGVSPTLLLMTRDGIVPGTYHHSVGLYFDKDLTPVVASHYQIADGDAVEKEKRIE
jgi:hypothetical protein